jgi:hypothetical protein
MIALENTGLRGLVAFWTEQVTSIAGGAGAGQ